MANTFTTRPWYIRHIVCMLDELGRSWYVTSYRNGQYKWSRDPLYARNYTEKTAQQHVARLSTSTAPDAVYTAPMLHVK